MRAGEHLLCFLARASGRVHGGDGRQNEGTTTKWRGACALLDERFEGVGPRCGAAFGHVLDGHQDGEPDGEQNRDDRPR